MDTTPRMTCTGPLRLSAIPNSGSTEITNFEISTLNHQEITFKRCGIITVKSLWTSSKPVWRHALLIASMLMNYGGVHGPAWMNGTMSIFLAARRGISTNLGISIPQNCTTEKMRSTSCRKGNWMSLPTINYTEICRVMPQTTPTGCHYAPSETK